MESLMEIVKGSFLATSCRTSYRFLHSHFWAMFLMVGIELTMFARDIRLVMNVISLTVTVVISLANNMAFGSPGGASNSLSDGNIATPTHH